MSEVDCVRRQAEGGGIFDVLSDEEELWMVEPSIPSANGSPAQACGWAANGERDGPSRDLSPDSGGPPRWVCSATKHPGWYVMSHNHNTTSSQRQQP